MHEQPWNQELWHSSQHTNSDYSIACNLFLSLQNFAHALTAAEVNMICVCIIYGNLYCLTSWYTGHLTAKSDVYSYGVVLLELLSGQRALDKNRPPGQHNLVEWARPYITNKRRVIHVLDSRLGSQYSLPAAQKVATLALQCLSMDARCRPAMDQVVTALEQLQRPRAHWKRCPSTSVESGASSCNTLGE